MKKIPAKKIAVLRALELGDMLCAVPAFRALRNAYPFSEITLLGLPWASEFVTRFSCYIDRFIPFPGYEGLPEQKVDEKKFAAFLTVVRKERFDLMIQMQGNGLLTNSLITTLGAKKTAGSFVTEQFCPDKETFVPYRTDISEVERNVSLVANLGIHAVDSSLDFPIFFSDREEFHNLAEYALLENQPYICIHPGARDEKRRWDPKDFAFIADQFIKHGYYLVFTGVQEEFPLIEAVISHMICTPIILAGRLSLGGTAALLETSQLVVTNATGIAHLADAVGAKSVVIFCNGDLTRWAPQNTRLHKTICGTEKGAKDRLLDEASLFLERRLV